MQRICKRQVILPSARIDGENPLPRLRHFPADSRVTMDASLPPRLRRRFGEQTAFRVLPYGLQDRYTRERTDRPLDQVCLENDQLIAAIVPSMGGRLWSLYDKQRQRECLFVNPVLQPANLAIRNAWFAGGVEWNLSHVGHAVHTCSPVFVARIDGPDGPFIRIYDFERMKQLFWQIDLHLVGGSPALLAHVRVMNRGREDVPMYWWTNIAVPETQGTRVFASADEVIYLHPGIPGQQQAGYGLARMPVLPSVPGKDFSYPTVSHFSNEYFFQCPDRTVNWEAVTQGDGAGFFEKSTAPLRYRKMFCWGQHAGGRHWQSFLSQPGRAYLEIQAGLAPTQMHGFSLAGGQALEWTQAFASVDFTVPAVHQSDWFEARNLVERTIELAYSDQALLEADRKCRELSCWPVSEILAAGSGWGALEIERLAAAGETPPSGLSFTADQIGPQQNPWLTLLRHGYLPEPAVGEKPAAWMIDPEWNRLLQDSLEHPSGRNGHTLLHLGVMAWENGRPEEALARWQASIAARPSVWAWACLAQASDQAGETEKALDCLAQAWALPESATVPGLAEMYLRLLHQADRNLEAWEIFRCLAEAERRSERVELMAGKVALKLGKLDFVEALFTREYATIREGERTLTDLWFEVQALRQAAQQGVAINQALRETVRQTMSPPRSIDFRQAMA